MTAKDLPDLPAASADVTAEPNTAAADQTPADQASKATIPAFTFPFSPAAFAPTKSEDEPWHQKGNKSSHHKTPGRAPNGTRRSMGKR